MPRYSLIVPRSGPLAKGDGYRCHRLPFMWSHALDLSCVPSNIVRDVTPWPPLEILGDGNVIGLDSRICWLCYFKQRGLSSGSQHVAFLL